MTHKHNTHTYYHTKYKMVDNANHNDHQKVTVIIKRLRVVMYALFAFFTVMILLGFFDDMFENHMKEIARLECYPTVYLSMYIRHSETTTITPITAVLVAVVDAVALIWLLYLYLRVLPANNGNVFVAVQGCVLMVLASVLLWGYETIDFVFNEIVSVSVYMYLRFEHKTK